MITDHGESLGRQSGLTFDDMVKVLIVAPGEHDVVHPTARSVDAVLGAVDLVAIIWVVLEGTRQDDTVIECTSDGKSIADDIPLSLGAIKEKKLAQVVDQAGKLHPSWLAISPNSLSRLK